METEILVQTNDRLVDKSQDKKIYVPRGAVIASVNQKIKQLKWLEIVYELASPRLRHQYAGKFPWFQVLIDRWTQEGRDRYFEATRSGALKTSLDIGVFWADYIVKPDYLSDCGYHPRKQRMLMETWLWGKKEKREFLPVSTGADGQIDVTKVEITGRDGVTYKTPSKSVDIVSALLSANVTEEEFNLIVDPQVTIETDFHRPVSKERIKDTEVPF